MNFKENKTAKSYFSCSLSSFLDGFGAVLRVFPITLLFTFLKRGKVGKSNGPALNRHDSTRLRLSWKNRKAREFCFGRAKVEHYSIVLSQSKRNRSLLTRCLSRENINLSPFTYAASIHCVHTSVTRPVHANGQEQKHTRQGWADTVFVHAHLKSTYVGCDGNCHIAQAMKAR